MNNVIDKVSNLLAGTGIAISLMDIQNILSIVCLVLNLGIIITRMVVKIVKATKDDNPNDMDQVEQILDDTEKELKNVKK